MKGMRPPKMRKIVKEKFGKGEMSHSEGRDIKFYEDELPEVKDWKVGEDYFLLVKVKQKKTGIKDEDYGPTNKKGKIYGEFEIKEISDVTEHHKKS